MTIVKRAQKPTPNFFKKLRKIGLVIAAVGATIIAAPVALPTIVIQIASYLAVAGSVMGGVSQVTLKNERQ